MSTIPYHTIPYHTIRAVVVQIATNNAEASSMLAHFICLLEWLGRERNVSRCK